ncbi:capsid protein [Rosellinia necatrix partitivirus 2]|uniref:Capsid protein n=1 Tax=Rosellinia necatrix partitivirus 2 TaxID=859651 RepID=F8WL22_9VIRU|nr:capsid protein [Rosellinia necatrix partitivirus 2]BAK53192.1 capsid protein [Rosellinia necatrix partitivirus 2]
MSTPSVTLSAFKAAVAKSGLEDQFLKLTGLTSMDELSADNFNEKFGQADSLTKSILAPSAAPVPHQEQKKEDADAKRVSAPVSASDFLYGFKHMTIQYASRKKNNTFLPSAFMMMYIIHEMNVLLCEHFYFKREAPNYHPLLLRTYFGILFIIQTLRAQHAANNLFGDQFEFLEKFLDAYPVDTLPIPAPLIHIFKSLCSSRPEIPQYGYVTPFVPEELWGTQLKDSPANALYARNFFPNIPYILSLYATLNSSTIKGSVKEMNSYLGNGTDDRTFAGHAYDKDPAQWTEERAFFLRSPGMEHALEGTSSFNKDFFENRFDNLEVPIPSTNDKVKFVDQFCYLSKNLAWFRDLVEIASAAAKFFEGSGTLADCSPVGPPVCQVQTTISNVDLHTAPTSISKGKSFYAEAHMKLTTTSRTMDQLSMIMASASHLNLRYAHATHSIQSRTSGPFWSLNPIESSVTDESSLIQVRQTVKKMMKSKV